jgi:hypothetical protein
MVIVGAGGGVGVSVGEDVGVGVGCPDEPDEPLDPEEPEEPEVPEVPPVPVPSTAPPHAVTDAPTRAPVAASEARKRRRSWVVRMTARKANAVRGVNPRRSTRAQGGEACQGEPSVTCASWVADAR